MSVKIVICKIDKTYNLYAVSDMGFKVKLKNAQYKTERGAKRGATKFSEMFHLPVDEVVIET